MSTDLRERLHIPAARIEDLNRTLLDPDSKVVGDFLEVVAKYGSPEEINRKAAQAGSLDRLLEIVRQAHPANHERLMWLTEQRDSGAFIRMQDYREQVLGPAVGKHRFDPRYAVTLEISAAQYFSWVIDIARQAIDQRNLMPGRFIRVRKMKEQEQDGDLPAFAAAMQIAGASVVETLDTKGTDGSNVHLGGPATITGYFGGIGQPNRHALAWLDEYLYYYTTFGVRQVLNINPGTVLLGYMLHRLGVDIEFKISVFMGNDNPYAALWTLLGAKLFSREDGSSPLIGFNWSNSIDNETMEITAQFRAELGFEEVVRFEHHIVETWKSIVRQPYNRRQELVQIADHVANISAKHEGGDPEVEETREHPSDILDYFRERQEIVDSCDWKGVSLNFHDKFDSLNRTAWALTEKGIPVVAARCLHL
ncbi:MAG TPA: hypothetical protein VI410_07940 [Anaerolineales bacterium]|nr:hypothetical protein [Anaerolineales bacterium]